MPYTEDELMEEIFSFLPVWESGEFLCFSCGHEYLGVYCVYNEVFECPCCGEMEAVPVI